MADPEPLSSYDVMVNLMVENSKYLETIKNLQSELEKTEEKTDNWGKAFKKAGGSVMGVIEKFQSGEMVINTFMDAFNSMNKIIENIEAIGPSAGMVGNQMNKFKMGIIQGAAETGKSFDAISQSAKAIFESTGLKEGLGQVVIDS